MSPYTKLLVHEVHDAPTSYAVFLVFLLGFLNFACDSKVIHPSESQLSESESLIAAQESQERVRVFLDEFGIQDTSITLFATYLPENPVSSTEIEYQWEDRSKAINLESWIDGINQVDLSTRYSVDESTTPSLTIRWVSSKDETMKTRTITLAPLIRSWKEASSQPGFQKDH